MSVWPSARWPIDTTDARLARAPAAPEIVPSTSAAPDSINELRERYVLRTKDWLAQSWSLLVAPRRFMDDWVSGRRETLSPPRFFAFGMTIAYFVEKGARYAIHLPKPPEAWWLSLLHSSFATMIMTSFLAAGLHPVLRLRGKAPIRATMAATIFSAAGPGVLLVSVAWMVSLAIYLIHGPIEGVQANSAFGVTSAEVKVPLIVSIANTIAFGWTLATLSGVHRVRWWWPLLAFVAFLLALMALGVGLTMIAAEVAKLLHLG